MRQEKFKFLLVAMLFATGLLFAGGEVRAATLSYNLSTTAITPSIVEKTQTYKFLFSPNAGTLPIGYVNLEIPASIGIPEGSFTTSKSNAGYSFTLALAGDATPLSGEVYAPGIGDFGTKFGVGDTRYRVMKVNIPLSATQFTLVLTITASANPPGKTLGTEAGVVLVKAGNGSNTQSFSPVHTPAWLPLTAPTLSNITVTPNPVQPPLCATITWTVPAGTTVAISPSDNVTVDATYTSALVCLVEAGSHTLTITATSADGASSTATTTVTVNPQPLIETTCKQIRKNPLPPATPSCIYLCMQTIDGVKQGISDAYWFDNPDCDPTLSPPVPLAIYAKDSPVKALVCAPCEISVPSGHPQACPENTDQNTLPFLFVQGGIYRNCDSFQYEEQDQGFAAVLGKDPWVVINGSMIWVR